jgi:hypothetical protein
VWLLMELFLRGVSSGFEIQDSVHVNGYDLSIVNCQLSIRTIIRTVRILGKNKIGTWLVHLSGVKFP